MIMNTIQKMNEFAIAKPSLHKVKETAIVNASDALVGDVGSCHP